MTFFSSKIKSRSFYDIKIFRTAFLPIKKIITVVENSLAATVFELLRQWLKVTETWSDSTNLWFFIFLTPKIKPLYFRFAITEVKSVVS